MDNMMPTLIKIGTSPSQPPPEFWTPESPNQQPEPKWGVSENRGVPELGLF